MEALRLLGVEHFWIARMLDCLERIATNEQTTGELDSVAATELFELFDSFSDGQHQEKEERHLFPRLQVHADTGEAALIHALEAEHRDDVGHMMRMRSTLQSAIQGDAVSRREFSRAATEFLDLERRHMTKERVVLFPLAERLLTKTDDKALLEAFDKLDRQGPQARERVTQRIRALCASLGIELERESAG